MIVEPALLVYDGLMGTLRSLVESSLGILALPKEPYATLLLLCLRLALLLGVVVLVRRLWPRRPPPPAVLDFGSSQDRLSRR